MGQMLTKAEKLGLSLDRYTAVHEAGASLGGLMPELDRLLWLGEPEVVIEGEGAGLCVSTATVGVFGAEAVRLSEVSNLRQMTNWFDLFHDLMAEKGWYVDLPRSSSEFIALCQADDFRGAFLYSRPNDERTGHLVAVVPSWLHFDEEDEVTLGEKGWVLVDSNLLDEGNISELDEGDLATLYATSTLSKNGQRMVFPVMAGVGGDES